MFYGFSECADCTFCCSNCPTTVYERYSQRRMSKQSNHLPSVHLKIPVAVCCHLTSSGRHQVPDQASTHQCWLVALSSSVVHRLAIRRPSTGSSLCHGRQIHPCPILAKPDHSAAATAHDYQRTAGCDCIARFCHQRHKVFAIKSTQKTPQSLHYTHCGNKFIQKQSAAQ